MPSILFTLDVGASTLSRTRNFDAATMTKLQSAITAELQLQGIPSPTNAQTMDYLVSRWIADTITFVRNREAAQAAATMSNLQI